MRNSGTKAQTNAPRKIRIIGGEWRSRQLAVLDHDGLRPTTDRVRETLFNWLAPSIVGARCLDLFAGSGALGLEALSRGAQYCQFVEVNSVVARAIEQTLETLNASTRGACHRGTAQQFLERPFEQAFDVVFLDPPFELGLPPEILIALEHNHALNHNARIYIESPRRSDPPSTPPNWHMIKEKVAGQSRYALYLREHEMAQ